MAEFNSVQFAQLSASPPEALSPTDKNGKPHPLRFDVVVGGTETNGDALRLNRLPSGAVVLDGFFTHDGVGDGTLTASIGTDADNTKYREAVVLTAAKQTLNISDEVGRNYGIKTTEIEDIKLFILGGTLSAGNIKGHINYISD